jgi:hypothetical protein
VSNDARTLYLLGLRPNASSVTGVTQPLDYKAAFSLLNSKSTQYTRGRQINTLIKELINANLVTLTKDTDIQHSLNNKSFCLPLITQSDDTTAPAPSPLLAEKFCMRRDWQPELETYRDIATLIGIIDPSYSDEILGEFIVYWLGRTDSKHTVYQWNQKFAQHVKRQRTALDTAPVKQTGTQTHTQSVSSVEADDNARRLVAKYKQTKHS